MFRQFRPFKTVVEASASYLWLVELLEAPAEKIVLANPKKLRVIAESTKKTDRLDAQVLAEFLAREMIPASSKSVDIGKRIWMLVDGNLSCIWPG